MENPLTEPLLVDQFESKDEGQMYVFYRCSNDKKTPVQGSLWYTKKKGYYGASSYEEHAFNKKETQILEAVIFSENKADKEALHAFIVAIYTAAGLTDKQFKEFFSPLENIYYNKSKLANLRQKLAHDVDKTLGTKLEEKKLAKPLKKIEKAVSDKLFGRVKE